MTSAMPVQCWCNAGAIFYQLSYEAEQLGAGQFVGLRCSREREQYSLDLLSKCLGAPTSRCARLEFVFKHNLVNKCSEFNVWLGNGMI